MDLQRGRLPYLRIPYLRIVLPLLSVVLGVVAAPFLRELARNTFVFAEHLSTEKVIDYATAQPERLTLDIKHKHIERLAHKREQALQQGLLFSSADDYVPAKIRVGSETIKVAIRLKGDFAESHLQPKKWSFRVKIKDDATLYGMKVFSLQAPSARNYIHEWIFHHAAKREGLIALRTDFVTLTVNGEDWGLYNLEEHFAKRLTESNQRREGPILKFGERLYWEGKQIRMANGEFAGGGAWDENHHINSAISPHGFGRALKNPAQLEMVKAAVSSLDAFRNGNLPAREVFDLNKFATYFALIDLLGAHHALHFHNVRFYYNPVTTLLEPIANDGNSGVHLKQLPIFQRAQSDHDWYAPFFQDQAFLARYVSELERISHPSNVAALFQDLEPELSERIGILHQGTFFQDPRRIDLSLTAYHKNAETIRRSLSPHSAIHAHFESSEKGELRLAIANTLPFPIEIIGVGKKKPHDAMERQVFLGKAVDQALAYQTVAFPTGKPERWTPREAEERKLYYRILGSSHMLEEVILSHPHPRKRFVDTLFTRQRPNPEQFSFLEVDQQDKIIRFQPGNWTLTESMILPKGYRIEAGPGTEINLTNGALILSFSPLTFVGREEDPIQIHSTDQTGQGLVVLQAERRSQLADVRFDGLQSPAKEMWTLTGAVTFFESPVDIRRCQFLNNTSEDGLNLVRSPYEISESLFSNTTSDAFDADFSDGEITHSHFVDCGNDGIDISGSRLKVDKITMLRVGDKGISVGEQSTLEAGGVKIEEAELALAAKDLSTMTIDSLELVSCRVGFTVYQKKPEFGPAAIQAAHYASHDLQVPYLLEEASSLVINGRDITPTHKDVSKILYGNLYGKATKRR